jgi:D-alanine-D-alanine ligase-like ATP-grasp enzyme
MTIEKRLKEKAHELAKREQKIVMYEEDLKNKAMEIKNSLISKEEEITTVKKRFLEEKRVIDLEKKKLTNSLAEAKAALDDQERKF